LTTQPLVLVADDEPRITKLVSISLGEEGFRVISASGGEDALRKAEEYRPDVVLLDIVMPDLDGIEVMRQLRERRPVPVILLTAKGSTADKAKGLDLGADDYVAKPFHPDELAARVRAVIRRYSGATPGAAPSLRRTRLTQTRRYWRSSRYSGPHTLVRSSVCNTTFPALPARCWSSSHSVRESWTSSPPRVTMRRSRSISMSSKRTTPAPGDPPE
jgi:DNA-binding response OmpR family regulator